MPGRVLRSIAKWLILLAGPLIWSLHLTTVYAAASLDITLTGRAGWPSRLFVGLATIACLIAIAWFGWHIAKGTLPRWRSPQQDITGLWRKTGLLLCVLAFAAVLWQGLPALTIPIEAVSHTTLFR